MNVTEVLETALLSTDTSLRAKATADLESAANADFGAYASLLANALSDSSTKTETRMLAALELKNRVRANSSLWVSLDVKVSAAIKQQILVALAGDDERVSRAVAQLAAVVGSIDVPRRLWSELLPALVAAVAPEKPEAAKKAALLTMGFLCESSDPNDEVFSDLSNGLFTGLTQAASEQEPSVAIRKTALDALASALEFLKKNFATEGERHYLMQVVCENTVVEDTQLQIAAFAVLSRIVGIYYSYMPLYMEKALYALTTRGMQNDDESLACMAIEFWSTVCEEEIDRVSKRQEFGEQLVGSPEQIAVYNFALGAVQAVIPALLQLLTKQNEEFDDDSWTVASAAGACLQLFAQDVGDVLVEPVVTYAAAGMSSSNWREREAGVMALGSILEGPRPETVKSIIGQSLEAVVALMGDDSSLHVKETVSWCLGRMADVAIESVAAQPALDAVVQCVVSGLNDHPRIIVNCCWTLINIMEQVSSDISEVETCPMSQYYATLVPILVQVSGRGDNANNARNSAYEALSTMVMYAPKDCMENVNLVAIEALNRLQYSLELQNQVSSAEDKSNLVELQASVVDLTTSVVRKAKNDALEVANNLMEVYLKLLSVGQEEDPPNCEEIFIAIGVLATSIGPAFSQYMSVFEPYLVSALAKTNNPICKSAVGLTIDITRALKEQIVPYAEEIMNHLGQTLSDPNIDNSLRAPIITCFGDMASAIEIQFQPYLEVVMKILSAAQKLQPENDSIEAFDFIYEINESVLDCYVGIVNGFRENSDVLYPYVSSIIEFLTTIPSNPNLFNSDAICGSAAGLIGDLAQIYGGSIKASLNQDWSLNFLKHIRRDPLFTDNTKFTAKWAKKVLG